MQALVDLHDLPDEALIRQAKDGSLEAFTTLYERHLPAVFNRVRYQVPENHVEDVTQEVFIKAFCSLQKFKGNASLGTWLYRITVNMSLNLIR